MIIPSDLYRWVARESSPDISTAGILLPATELPAADCHVCAAAAQPRGDPDGQCSHLFSFGDDPIARGTCWTSYASPGFAAWSRAYRTRLSCRLRAIFDIRMLGVYVAYCQARFFLRFLLASWSGRPPWDRPWKIVRRACGNWFRSSSHRCPADKSSWSNIRIREADSARFCANVRFLQRPIDYHVIGNSSFFYSRCIQSDINIRRFSAEIATRQITRISQFVASWLFINLHFNLSFSLYNTRIK